MQELFSRERSVITKYINNVFKEGELWTRIKYVQNLHILRLTIKRIGYFLFLYFLQINGLLPEQNFDNKAPVALALLTAASNPWQKDLLIRLIINLLTETEEGP